MTDGLVAAIVVGVAPVAFAGGAALVRTWYRKVFLPDGRITSGQERCDALLDMARRLDADGQALWAGEWRGYAHKAMLRPLAEMEFARKHKFRSGVSGILMATYAAFPVTLLLNYLFPGMEYLVGGLYVVLVVVVVCWLQAKLGNHKRVSRLVEEKLAELMAADVAALAVSRERERGEDPELVDSHSGSTTPVPGRACRKLRSGWRVV